MAFLILEKIFRFTVVRWFSVLAYTGLVCYLCLMPAGNIKSNTFLDLIHFDKWVHVMMYFGTWTMLVWGFKGNGPLVKGRQKIFRLSAIIALFMGGSIEYLQSYIGRGMDWTDQVANFAGILLAWYCWLKFENKWKVYRW